MRLNQPSSDGQKFGSLFRLSHAESLLKLSVEKVQLVLSELGV